MDIDNQDGVGSLLEEFSLPILTFPPLKWEKIIDFLQLCPWQQL